MKTSVWYDEDYWLQLKKKQEKDKQKGKKS